MFDRSTLHLAGLSLAAFAFSGSACCPCNVENASAPVVRGTENFSLVTMNWDRNPPLSYSETLNEWLKKHPGQKVTGLAGVLAYRDGCSEFVVQHVPGDNSRQSFHDAASEKGPRGINELQSWADANPNSEIVAITSIPGYSGGVKAWVFCAEERAR